MELNNLANINVLVIAFALYLKKNDNIYSLSMNQSRRLRVHFQLGSFSMDVQIYIPYLVVSKSLFGTLDILPVLAILCPGLV